MTKWFSTSCALLLTSLAQGQDFGVIVEDTEVVDNNVDVSNNNNTNSTPTIAPSSAPTLSPTRTPCLDYLVQATSDWLVEDEYQEWLEIYIQIYDNANHKDFGFTRGDFVKDPEIFYYELNETIWDNPWHNESNVLEGCLPLDQCYMAIIDDYMEDGDIEFYVDGQNMLSADDFQIECSSGTNYCPSEEDDSEDYGRALRFVEFGNCDIECAEGEKLLELEFYGYPAIDWKIYDANADGVVDATQECGEACQYKWNERYYKQRRCLASNQCHRLVTFSEQTSDASFNATFDGQIIATQLENRFDSDLIFGDNCGANDGAAGQSCGGDSLLELFLEREFPDTSGEIPMPALQVEVSNGGGQTVEKFDGVATTEGLFYLRTCVPSTSSSCMGVTLSNPDETKMVGDREYFEKGEWLVQLDSSNIHRDGEYSFAASDNDPYQAGYEDTAQCGTCSTAQDMGCNSENEALFELTINADTSEPFQDFDWDLYYTTGDDPENPTFNYIKPFGYSTGQYSPDSTYTHYFCIPSEECPVFETTDYGNVPFVVAVDGDEVNQDKATETVQRGGYEYTNINLVCSSGLSTGAVAGIAVGVALAVVLIAGGICWYCKTKKAKEAASESDTGPSKTVVLTHSATAASTAAAKNGSKAPVAASASNDPGVAAGAEENDEANKSSNGSTEEEVETGDA